MKIQALCQADKQCLRPSRGFSSVFQYFFFTGVRFYVGEGKFRKTKYKNPGLNGKDLRAVSVVQLFFFC